MKDDIRTRYFWRPRVLDEHDAEAAAEAEAIRASEVRISNLVQSMLARGVKKKVLVIALCRLAQKLGS